MPTEKRLEKIRNMISHRQNALVIVLEDVHDPHNAMAVARTCDALGVQELKLVFEKQAGFNPKKVGKASSSTANKWLDFEKFTDIDSCVEPLKKNGYRIVGTAMRSEKTESIFDVDLSSQKTALLFGNEHSGLSEKAISHCDVLVTIPMLGMVESLNISVAAAILMYETVRQRSKHPEKYRLTQVEQNELMAKLSGK
jgi:tRNA (guanosine-2'-O-)-methyltransferase